MFLHGEKVLIPVQNRSDVEAYLASNLSLHEGFFWNRTGNLLVFAERCASAAIEPEFVYAIDGQTDVLSKEFLVKNAYELGVQAVWRANGAAVRHARVRDNWHPYINVDWGVGVTASLLTGREDVVFEKSTSYSAGPVVRSWDDLAGLSFDVDNLWIDCVRRFWHGVASADLYEGVTVMPYMYRSPLDFANDLRGNSVFVDMHDHPREVESLVAHCARCILELDEHLRNECPILRSRPGGVWGAGFGKETKFLNGDPVDLISEEMGRQFNNPFVEMLTSTDSALFFHHHSIGHNRANLVADIENLTVQEILQDPNGPALVEVIDDDLIKASMKTPIYFDVDISMATDYESILEKLSQGRFVISLGSADGERLATDGEFRKSLELARQHQGV